MELDEVDSHPPAASPARTRHRRPTDRPRPARCAVRFLRETRLAPVRFGERMFVLLCLCAFRFAACSLIGGGLGSAAPAPWLASLKGASCAASANKETHKQTHKKHTNTHTNKQTNKPARSPQCGAMRRRDDPRRIAMPRRLAVPRSCGSAEPTFSPGQAPREDPRRRRARRAARRTARRPVAAPGQVGLRRTWHVTHRARNVHDTRCNTRRARCNMQARPAARVDRRSRLWRRLEADRVGVEEAAEGRRRGRQP
jgi:hypothetical protein